MSAKSGRLGRGLAALLSEEAPVREHIESAPPTDKPVKAGDIVHLPIETVRANPNQPRKHFDADAIAELAGSIKEKGLLQPILVRPASGKAGDYEIVAGERRWRAAQKAQLHKIPCVIRELSDQDSFEIAIIENVQREELSAVEEARAYKSLAEEYGYSQDKIADAVGKSRSHVANLMRLLKLPDDIQNLVTSGEISMGHARALLSSDAPAPLAKRVIEEGMTVRDLEKAVKQTAAAISAPGEKSSKPKSSIADKDADTRALEADLSAATGLKVEISNQGEKGVVTIAYQTLEQLDDICSKLSRGR